MTREAREELLRRALDGEADVAALPEDLRAELAATGAVVAALRQLPEVELPAGWDERLLRRLRLAMLPAPPGRRWLPRTWGAAAAAAVVVVAAGLVAAHRPPRVGTSASAALHAAAAPMAPAAGARSPAVGGAAAVASLPASAPGQDLAERKIIVNANLTLRVRDVRAAARRVGDLASGSGGYVAASSLSQQAGQVRAAVTARVPADRLAAFTDAVAALGEVTDAGQSSNDVTQQYIDVSGRLDALRAEQQAYTDLLRRAANVDEALKVQQALTDVEAQIESLTRQVQTMDQLASLATVNVTLVPESSQPSLPAGGGPLPARLAAALANSWRVLAAAAATVVVAAAWALPWLGILGAAAGLAWAAAGRRRRSP
jgi:hypothetical protein